MAQSKSKTLVDSECHVLYCGVTMSGKTTLARHHALLLHKSKHEVAVYDPVGTHTINGTWPDKVKVFTDNEQFLKWLVSAHGTPENPVFVFVDESADIFGHDNREANFIPRRVRHQNIYLRLISQRPKMLPPNVRSQCAQTYMFRLAADDAKMVCADSGHGSEISQIQLDTGDFILLLSGSSEIVQSNVFELTDS